MNNTQTDLSYLLNYAFCGVEPYYSNHFTELASLAENEIWTFDNSKPNSILQTYIINTFTRCYKQNKVIENDNNSFSCFNTGLLTPNGNDIIGLFEQNQRQGAQPWVFKGFRDKCNRDFMKLFIVVPELATYTDNFEEYYYNPDLDIVINTDHILDDNWTRISDNIPLPKDIVKTLLIGVVEEAKKRIKRNVRLVIPQFYKEKIMYLVPIKIPIADNSFETMALAVEKINDNQYRANTIFTKEIAYEKARLLMKPETNWLLPTIQHT